MRLRSVETYWLLRNGLLSSYPSLRQNIACDILVVGGGITGSLMAYQLSKEGYKTVLLDKRDVSLGSTSATTALLQYEIDEPLYSLIEKEGPAVAVDSYQEGVNAIHQLGRLVKSLKIDCHFEHKHSLYVAHNQSSADWMAHELDCRAAAGIKVKWLSAQQILDTYQVKGHGAILSDTAASVDGYRLAHALLAHAVANHNLEIYDHTAIESIDHDAHKNYVYTKDAYTINCQHIIYATGYETQEFINEKIVNLISTYAMVSEPLKMLPDVFKNTIFWDTNDPYLYVRGTSDNRILVGGGDEPFKNPERRDKLIDKKELILLEKFNEMFPGVNIIPDFTWAGTFGVTKDALPYIGAHPDFPNSHFVLGFGGNGITFSVMAMQIISDALAGKSNKFLEYFRFGR